MDEGGCLAPPLAAMRVAEGVPTRLIIAYDMSVRAIFAHVIPRERP
jgi:hypothetical protein